MYLSLDTVTVHKRGVILSERRRIASTTAIEGFFDCDRLSIEGYLIFVPKEALASSSVTKVT